MESRAGRVDLHPIVLVIALHLILQTESCLTGCPAPATQGHVSLDWISVWVPA